MSSTAATTAMSRLNQVARLNAIVGQLGHAAALDKITLTQEALSLLVQMKPTMQPLSDETQVTMQAALQNPHKSAAVEAALLAYLDTHHHAPDLVRVAHKIYRDKFHCPLPNLASEASEPLSLFEAYAHKRHKAFASEVAEPDHSVDALVEGLRKEVQAFKYAESAVAAFEAAAAKVGLPAIREAMAAFRAAVPQGYAEQRQYYQDHQKERVRLNTAYTKANNKADALYQTFCREQTADKVAQIQALLDQKHATGVAAIGQLHEWSSVSLAQAQAWVAQDTTIEPAALARLKREGYRTDIQEDLADFYRLTGGKLGKVVLKSEGDSRANTRDVFGDGAHEVFMGRSFTRKTLFHELGHQLERDPVASLLANEFLLRRRESDTLYSLNELTSSRGYDRDEVAYKDSWISPYVGKRYRNQTTEVFSMAMEHLSTPERAQTLMVKDREMFDVVTGYITSDMSELSQFNRALSEARMAQKQASADSEQAKRAAQDQIIAAAVLIDQSISEEAALPDLSELQSCQQFVRWESKKGSSAQWYGQYRHWLIYSGVFKDRRVSKWLKGFVMVNSHDVRSWASIKTVAGDVVALKRLLWQLTHE